MEEGAATATLDEHSEQSTIKGIRQLLSAVQALHHNSSSDSSVKEIMEHLESVDVNFHRYSAKCWLEKNVGINLTKFSHPNIVNALKCNRALIITQFAKVFPSKCTSRVMLLKFHLVNISCYTLFNLQLDLLCISICYIIMYTYVGMLYQQFLHACL